jgi:hypothetical protein
MTWDEGGGELPWDMDEHMVLTCDERMVAIESENER